MRTISWTALVLVAMLSTPVRPGSVAADSEPREPRLDAQIDELLLNNVTLDEAVAILQQKSHANIVVEWGELNADQVHRIWKAYVHVRNTTLGRALNVILAAYGWDRATLNAHVEDGAIHIGRRVTPAVMLGSTLVYDIEDFTTRFIEPNDPNVSSAAFNGLFGAPSPRAAPIKGGAFLTQNASRLSRQECIDLVIRFIQEVVTPDSWRDMGGQIGAIREAGGLLVISQTPENHLKIQTLLKNLRALRAAIDRGEPINSAGIDLLDSNSHVSTLTGKAKDQETTKSTK